MYNKMNETFNVTEWVLKSRLSDTPLKENTYAFITHVVNNLFPLYEYSDAEIKRLMAQFKEEADDLNIEITDAALEAAIKRFDQLKNSPKITEKDLRKYSLAKLLKLTSSSEGADVPEEETGPDVAYSENGYTIFSGASEELCRRHQGTVPWCITRGSFGNYRYSADRNYPTFYLVKNANLPDNNKLSFVAIQVRANGDYVYTNRDNSPHESSTMSWEKLNEEIPWLRNIPNVKSLLRYIPLSAAEKATQIYGKTAISFRKWEELSFSEKKQYLVVRKNTSGFFSDITNREFVEKHLQNYPQLATFFATNPDLIDPEILFINIEKFSPQDQKSIIKNLRTLFNANVYFTGSSSSLFSFDLKKYLTEKNKWSIGSNERLYVTKDKNAIVKLTFEANGDVKVGVFTEERDYPNIKLNARTAKFLLDYPEIDQIPFATVLKLADKEVVDSSFVNKILEKAKADPNSAIVVEDTDAGQIIIDSNTFSAYKIENNKVVNIPFDSEEVQSVFTDETRNQGFQDAAVALVFNASRESKSLPKTLNQDSFLRLLNNTPYSKRTGLTKNNLNGVMLVNPSSAGPQIFIVGTDRKLPETIVDYGRSGTDWTRYDYSNRLESENIPTYVNYVRATNQSFTDDELKNFLARVGSIPSAAINFINSNPPLAPNNQFRPVVFNNIVWLVNTADPSQSLALGKRGNFLSKSLSPLQVRRLLGGEAPATTPTATPTAGRRGRPAGTTRQPAAPAPPPAPGQGLRTALIMAEYGLTAGWSRMPTRIQNALVTVTTVRGASRGSTRRNNLLGNRGRVVRALETGANSIYIIRLANGTHVASINTQPGNGHFLILPNTSLNIGSPSNLLTALQNNNLAESLAHVVVGEFLAQNPTMIDEAKNALRLISKSK